MAGSDDLDLVRLALRASLSGHRVVVGAEGCVALFPAHPPELTEAEKIDRWEKKYRDPEFLAQHAAYCRENAALAKRLVEEKYGSK